jgi:hypothetical protein
VGMPQAVGMKSAHPRRSVNVPISLAFDPWRCGGLIDLRRISASGHDLVEELERDILAALPNAAVVTPLEPSKDPSALTRCLSGEPRASDFE